MDGEARLRYLVLRAYTADHLRMPPVRHFVPPRRGPKGGWGRCETYAGGGLRAGDTMARVVGRESVLPQKNAGET